MDIHPVFNRTLFNSFQKFYDLKPILLPTNKISYQPDLHSYSSTRRTAMIKITTEGRFDDDAPFGSDGLIAKFNINSLRRNGIEEPEYWKYICLAEADPDTGIWNCVNRYPDWKLTKGNPLTLGYIAYKIYRPGAYCVMAIPENMPNEKPDAYKSIFVLNRLAIYSIIFAVFPLIILLLKILKELFAYIENCKTKTLDRLYLTEQVERLREATIDFVGQKMSEKVNPNEELEFEVNPIFKKDNEHIAEQRVVNMAIEKVTFEKEELEKTRKNL